MLGTRYENSAALLFVLRTDILPTPCAGNSKRPTAKTRQQFAKMSGTPGRNLDMLSRDFYKERKSSRKEHLHELDHERL